MLRPTLSNSQLKIKAQSLTGFKIKVHQITELYLSVISVVLKDSIKITFTG